MNSLTQHRNHNKAVQAQGIFSNGSATATAIFLTKESLLKEHTTPINALLLCVTGEVVFNNELHQEQLLQAGNYIEIQHDVKHWVLAKEDSTLLLCR